MTVTASAVVVFHNSSKATVNVSIEHSAAGGDDFSFVLHGGTGFTYRPGVAGTLTPTVSARHTGIAGDITEDVPAGVPANRLDTAGRFVYSYRKAAEKKLKGMHPDQQAKEALVKASFSSREREEFFEDAYGELLVEYFVNWLKTEPHENKTREFIYNSALALGDVKQKLIGYEMYGRNIPHMGEDNESRD